MEELDTVKKSTEHRQPFYCHWHNGVWDGKFRDKNGNVVGDEAHEQKSHKRFKQPFYCYLVNGEWDRKFRDKDGNIVE